MPDQLSSQLAHEPQLRRAVAHEHGGERGAEAAAAGVEFHHPSRAICRRISSAWRRMGCTSRPAVSSHSVEVMERIRISRRTQGRRYGRYLMSWVLTVRDSAESRLSHVRARSRRAHPLAVRRV
jgi:hypothetical protein